MLKVQDLKKGDVVLYEASGVRGILSVQQVGYFRVSGVVLDSSWLPLPSVRPDERWLGEIVFDSEILEKLGSENPNRFD